jgi:hypothetical protein
MKLKDAIIQACHQGGTKPPYSLSRPYKPYYVPGSKAKARQVRP